MQLHILNLLLAASVRRRTRWIGHAFRARTPAVTARGGNVPRLDSEVFSTSDEGRLSCFLLGGLANFLERLEVQFLAQRRDLLGSDVADHIDEHGVLPVNDGDGHAGEGCAVLRLEVNPDVLTIMGYSGPWSVGRNTR